MNFCIYPQVYLVYRFSSALTRLSCFARSALHERNLVTFRPKHMWKRPLVFTLTLFHMYDKSYSVASTCIARDISSACDLVTDIIMI